MASVLDNLNTAYANVAANLAAITADPKPTYTIDGENVCWQELFDSYTLQLEKLKQAIQREESPWMVRTRLRP